jgi:hypothetical protein
MDCTALHCAALRCTTLYCAALHCAASHLVRIVVMLPSRARRLNCQLISRSVRIMQATFHYTGLQFEMLSFHLTVNTMSLLQIQLEIGYVSLCTVRCFRAL